MSNSVENSFIFEVNDDSLEIIVHFTFLNEKDFTTFLKKVSLLNIKKEYDIIFNHKNWNKEGFDLSSFLNKNNNDLIKKLFNKNTIYENCLGEKRQVVFIEKYKRIFTG